MTDGSHRFAPALLVISALVLAGCQGAVSTDLSADAPADPQIAGVNVDLAGVEFERSDGGTEKIEFTASQRTDLVTLLDGGSLRLLTDEQISEGTYTGVRLLIEDNDDASVVLADNSEFDALIQEGDYAAIDFTVAEDESSSRSLAITLDLRKSLSFDEGNRQYSLTPVLRVTDEEEAGQISGDINVSCPLGTSLQEGGAVYLFEGEDVEPSDIDGAGTEPYATSAVLSNFGTSFSYSLRFLPAGDYTIALTCNGEIDVPASMDDVEFVRTANVTVDADSVTYDFE